MILKLLITRGNITVIHKEATQEKENIKLQPEKIEKERKSRIKIRKKMINTPTTRAEKQKNIHDISLSILLYWLWFVIVVVVVACSFHCVCCCVVFVIVVVGGVVLLCCMLFLLYRVVALVVVVIALRCCHCCVLVCLSLFGLPLSPPLLVCTVCGHTHIYY